MRIVAGEFRGRALATPQNNAIRPTSDRVRESLFSILQSKYSEVLNGARVIDLFAGTGAFGLEAISRGAAFSMFVDNSSDAHKLITENIRNLRLENRTKLMQRDITRLGGRASLEPFDIAFADPPYGKGLAEKAAIYILDNGWLTRDGLMIIEEQVESAPPDIPSFVQLDRRVFGNTALWFLKPE